MGITGRDAESITLTLDFEYPLHTVNEAEEFVRKSKVEEAKAFIVNELDEKVRSRQKLRRKAMKAGHTDYAFNAAIRQLKDEKCLKSVQSKGTGNRKLLKLVK